MSDKKGIKARQNRRRLASSLAILFLLLALACLMVVFAEVLVYYNGQSTYNKIREDYVETVSDENTSLDTTEIDESERRSEAEQIEIDDNTESVAGESSEQRDSTANYIVTDNKSKIIGIDFESLIAQNNDTVAWIEIPGTNISYPVMFRQGDSEYYLTHDFYGEEAKQGAIHLDGASNGIDSENILIYGHNLLDGTMFSALHRYKSQSFYLTHPLIYLHLPDGSVRHYRIAAVCLTQGVDKNMYKSGFSGVESAQSYYDYLIEHSIYDTGVEIDANDGKQTVVLSTCYLKVYRRVILAVQE